MPENPGWLDRVREVEAARREDGGGNSQSYPMREPRSEAEHLGGECRLNRRASAFTEELITQLIHRIRPLKDVDAELWKLAVKFCNDYVHDCTKKLKMLPDDTDSILFRATTLEKCACAPEYWDWEDFPGIGRLHKERLVEAFKKLHGLSKLESLPVPLFTPSIVPEPSATVEEMK